MKYLLGIDGFSWKFNYGGEKKFSKFPQAIQSTARETIQ
jgi:hypothetical protein